MRGEFKGTSVYFNRVLGWFVIPNTIFRPHFIKLIFLILNRRTINIQLVVVKNIKYYIFIKELGE